MTPEEIAAAWGKIEAACVKSWSAATPDTRLASLREQAKDFVGEDLADFLEASLGSLTTLLDDLKNAKRRRLEKSLSGTIHEGIVLTSDDSSDDDHRSKSRRSSGKTGKTYLENRLESHKRNLARKYLECVGGRAGWKVNELFRAFLTNSSLPATFDRRLTCLVNESVQLARAFEVLKDPKGPKEADLVDLGHLVLAEASARAAILFFAHEKQVKENFTWSENLLESQLELQGKSLLSLALRDAGGNVIQGDCSSFSDIFDVKSTTKTPERAGAHGAGAGGYGGGGGTPRPGPKAGSFGSGNTKDWWLLPPVGKVKDVGTVCPTCKGWGHGAASCVRSAGWNGHCSQCHGRGHRRHVCPSK